MRLVSQNAGLTLIKWAIWRKNMNQIGKADSRKESLWLNLLMSGPPLIREHLLIQMHALIKHSVFTVLEQTSFLHFCWRSTGAWGCNHRCVRGSFFTPALFPATGPQPVARAFGSHSYRDLEPLTALDSPRLCSGPSANTLPCRPASLRRCRRSLHKPSFGNYVTDMCQSVCVVVCVCESECVFPPFWVSCCAHNAALAAAAWADGPPLLRGVNPQHGASGCDGEKRRSSGGALPAEGCAPPPLLFPFHSRPHARFAHLLRAYNCKSHACRLVSTLWSSQSWMWTRSAVRRWGQKCRSMITAPIAAIHLPTGLLCQEAL